MGLFYCSDKSAKKNKLFDTFKLISVVWHDDFF